MFGTVDKGVVPLVKALYVILDYMDPELNQIISEASMHEAPSIIMPWLLTWLSHKMGDKDQIGRSFDYFLSSHPIASLFASATVFVFIICRSC